MITNYLKKKKNWQAEVLLVFAGFFILFSACGKKQETQQLKQVVKPVISDQGKIIRFPDTSSVSYFTIETIKKDNVQADLTAPARVVATVIRSTENPNLNLILFDNPDLTANYRAIEQHLININQYKLNLSREKDLYEHGAATGKEVIEAQTQLANEQTAITEDEAKLKLAGFNPQDLIHAKSNVVWVICDIPENQLGKLKTGGDCQAVFSSFPEKTFTGKLEAFGDVVDNVTRMVKLRISIQNPNNMLKAGMFASVQFGISEGNFITVPKSALVTVEGKNFVFIKRGVDEFERKEVMTGQQVNDRVIVYSGISNDDKLVTSGVMQLKGLSFGY